MGFFRTDFDKLLQAVLTNAATAAWTAFVPLCALISLVAATPYYYVAVLALGLARESPKRYHAACAACGAASVIYAMNGGRKTRGAVGRRRGIQPRGGSWGI